MPGITAYKKGIIKLISAIKNLCDRIDRNIDEGNGLPLLTTVAALEYAVISTLASNKYTYLEMETTESIGSFVLWVTSIALLYSLCYGVSEQIKHFIGEPPTFKPSGNKVLFASKAYISFYFSYLIISIIAGGLFGYEAYSKKFFMHEYINIISMVLCAVSCIVIASEFIGRTLWIQHLISFSVYFAVICFYFSIYADISMKSLVERVEYCSSLAKLHEKESSKLNRSMCADVNKK